MIKEIVQKLFAKVAKGRLVGGIRLVRQEVQDVPAVRGLRLVQFGIAATCATDRDEPFVLYIKDFCEISAGRLELVMFEVGATAFRTDILSAVIIIWHFFFLLSEFADDMSSAYSYSFICGHAHSVLENLPYRNKYFGADTRPDNQGLFRQDYGRVCRKSIRRPP